MVLTLALIALAESEDQAEHQYSKADEREKRSIDPHLERSDIEKFNDLVAERLERAIRAGEARQSQAWVRSMTWYLFFMKKRANHHADLLLANPQTIAIVLSVMVSDQAVEQDRRHLSHHATNPMFLAKHCFGFDRFDKAVLANEAELRNLGEAITKRIDIYRYMREHFSDLADPKPQSAEPEVSGS